MQDFITHFGIDWKLLLAQIVNFSILLILLTKFVYRPVLEVLQQRKKKIEDGLQFAKDSEEELRRAEIMRGEVLAEAKGKAFLIVTGAEHQAKQKETNALIATARKTEAAIAEAKRIIQDEKMKMQDEFQKEARELVYAGVVRVLHNTPSEIRDTPLIMEAMKELKNISFTKRT